MDGREHIGKGVIPLFALATAVMVFLLKLFTTPDTPVLGYSGALGFSGLLAVLCLLCVILFVRDQKGDS